MQQIFIAKQRAMEKVVDDSEKKDQDGNNLAQKLAELVLDVQEEETVKTGKEAIEGATFKTN